MLWYKFAVTPGSKVTVDLANLAVNYDITLYRDIAATYQTLADPQNITDLAQQDAESPDVWIPDVWIPDVWIPDVWIPDVWIPDVWIPDVWIPDVWIPDVWIPDVWIPDVWIEDEQSYTSAQVRSLIGASAEEGTLPERIVRETWNSTGDFYVRVKGREGAYSVDQPYHLSVGVDAGGCTGVTPLPTFTPPLLPPGVTPQTLILTNVSRMPGDANEKAALQEALAAFAARAEVDGLIVNVGADAWVAGAMEQALSITGCPYAMNLAATAIRDIVTAYRSEASGLKYVVIVGGDDVIPFFRYPDQAGKAPESDYSPPVALNTASDASLRLDYFLSQDAYGSPGEVLLPTGPFPLPGLAVGRLVETPAEVMGMLAAYTDAQGIMPAPTKALVTGYDFLADSSEQVQVELAAGMGTTGEVQTLISAKGSQQPDAWTAGDLTEVLLNSGRHDLVYLGGHFSANTALAADDATRIYSPYVATSSTDFVNALVFSPGCHAGYNIVDVHNVIKDPAQGGTLEPDWAQTFARKRATFISGTGFQYGETLFVENSERLYLEFAHELRRGVDPADDSPVAIGEALVKAKRAYLAGTAQWRGLHEKAVLEATLFGLPMMRIDMPGRWYPGAEASIVPDVTQAGSDPGEALGLQIADITRAPALADHEITLPAENASSQLVHYLSGPDGVVSSPAEPVLPLESNNVTVDGLALRGVGFLGGAYVDETDIVPLTGAPAAYDWGGHSAFAVPFFYPVRPWSVNYFDAMAGGATYLNLMPAQFRSDDPASPAGTRRKFTEVTLRLFYSANTAKYEGNVPALAAPPAIEDVAAAAAGGQVRFTARALGDPAAGIQAVWVTYTRCPTGACDGMWQSLELARDALDGTLWTGALSVAGAMDIRFMVQAANGVGLVTMATNMGQYYAPTIADELTPTALSLTVPAAALYHQAVAVETTLTAARWPLPGKLVALDVTDGPQTRWLTAITDQSGHAAFTLTELSVGDHALTVHFADNTVLPDGTQLTDPRYAASTATAALTVQYQPAGTLCLGAPGHAILQPINADGTSVFKWKSTVPVKFRVCDAAGASIGEAGVVSKFFLVKTQAGTAVSTINEPVESKTGDTAFHWDPGGQKWMFNIGTKTLKTNTTYFYQITLNDGSTIDFSFGLR